MDSILFETFIYLCAAVVAVPIAQRLGLGSVLGYLSAGILIGPLLGLVGSETETIRHVAEFGVVLMLFLVGLELQPQALWAMRARFLGLGGLQVVVSALLIAAGGLILGLDWRVAIAVGLIFSLSSTAIVLQTLSEKGLTGTEGGRSSFSVLLFQDVAVIPMLALIPLLALPELSSELGPELSSEAAASTPASAEHASAEQASAEQASAEHGHAEHGASMSLVADLPGWAHALVVLGAVSAVLLGGHFLSRPLFRFIADARLREIFTASALLLVVGIALLMTLVDLSPALGTFLAGVVLASSEFRTELESDIEPFKGLLLGLFFITVGAGIDFGVLSANLTLVLALTAAVILVKGLVLFAVAGLFRLKAGDRWLFGLALAPAGEFGFVLLSFSQQNAVIAPDLAKILSLVVALSMLLTPALFVLYSRLVLPRLRDGDDREPDAIEQPGTVIIAGVGRFGQIVNRMLLASSVRTVVLDHEAAILDMLRELGIKAYYGDASRPDLLQAAGIADAAVFVVAIDNRERAVQMVEYVRRNYPQVQIIARAFDVNHLYLLKQAGADVAVREVFDASTRVGSETLRRLGLHPFKVEKMEQAFRRHDAAGLAKLYEVWDEHPDIARNRAYLARAREHGEALKEMMETDRLQLHDRSERGWTPPPKGYTDELDR